MAYVCAMSLELCPVEEPSAVWMRGTCDALQTVYKALNKGQTVSESFQNSRRGGSQRQQRSAPLSGRREWTLTLALALPLSVIRSLDRHTTNRKHSL
jgi:hypothetical protein